MKTINLEIASQKGRKLSEFLDGLAHVPSNAPAVVLAVFWIAEIINRAHARSRRGKP